MMFRDEFEETVSGVTYNVSIEGNVYEEDGFNFTEVTAVDVTDELGNLLDESHPVYEDLVDLASNREYSTDVQSVSYSHYDDLENF